MRKFYHQGDWTYEVDSPKELLKYRLLQLLGAYLTIGIIALAIYIMNLILS